MKLHTISDPQTAGKPNYLILAGIILATVLALAFPPQAPASNTSTQRAERARVFLIAEDYRDIQLSTPSAHPDRCKGVGALADFTAQGFEMQASGTVCDTPTHETSTIAIAPPSLPTTHSD